MEYIYTVIGKGSQMVFVPLSCKSSLVFTFGTKNKKFPCEYFLDESFKERKYQYTELN